MFGCELMCDGVLLFLLGVACVCWFRVVWFGLVGLVCFDVFSVVVLFGVVLWLMCLLWLLCVVVCCLLLYVYCLVCDRLR